MTKEVTIKPTPKIQGRLARPLARRIAGAARAREADCEAAPAELGGRIAHGLARTDARRIAGSARACAQNARVGRLLIVYLFWIWWPRYTPPMRGIVAARVPLQHNGQRETERQTG